MDRDICLDGRDMDTREHAHSLLAGALNLPPWYGRNLDALYDCLGDITAPTHLVLTHPKALRKALGDYGSLVIQVLRDAASRNPHLGFDCVEDGA